METHTKDRNTQNNKLEGEMTDAGAGKLLVCHTLQNFVSFCGGLARLSRLYRCANYGTTNDGTETHMAALIHRTTLGGER
jgi:hypothetical protein